MRRALPPAQPRTAPVILLTGAGKRYDIVSCFARLTTTVVADPSPLAPAQYAAQVRAAVPLIDDPATCRRSQALCEQHGVGAVLPLTDLDIEVLARATREGGCPRSCPPRRSRARPTTSTRPTCCWSASACPRRRRCCPSDGPRRAATTR